MPEPLRQHRPIDSSVVSLEAESLPFNCSRFLNDVRTDMRTLTLDELHKRYPELTFAHEPKSPGSSRRPKGHDMTENLGRAGYCTADWRH